MEGVRQGSTEGWISLKIYKLRLWKLTIPLPTMHCGMNHIKNKDLVNIAGGLYAGIVALILAWIYDFTLPFTTLFVVQICYGIFEWKFLPTWGASQKYYRWKSLLYIAIVFLMVFLYVTFFTL
jgi:hypothetical protein